MIDSHYKLILLVIATSIAAMGTIPYSFQFANFIKPYNYHAFVIVGVTLSVTAMFSNIALGIYSFVMMQIKSKSMMNRHSRCLQWIGLISAIPMGCISYFAYRHILSLAVIITVTVVLVNAAISYTAVINFILQIRDWRLWVKTRGECLSRLCGLMIGLAVSLTAYMAVINGLIDFLVALFQMPVYLAFRLSCAVGFIAWLPYALLFANATQFAIYQVYLFLMGSIIKVKAVNRYTYILLLFATCSGASFAQMTIIFFGPNMHLPHLFMQNYMQSLIYDVLVPLSYFSSVAVNYFALKGVADYLNQKYHFSIFTK